MKKLEAVVAVMEKVNAPAAGAAKKALVAAASQERQALQSSLASAGSI